jgi:hypothetical protein
MMKVKHVVVHNGHAAMRDSLPVHLTNALHFMAAFLINIAKPMRI